MVRIVVQELIAPDKWDIIAAISPAITRPTKPDGRMFFTSVGKIRSAFSRFGNICWATSAGLGLDKLNAMWFEAPIDPEDVAGHAALARAIKTPVAIGEPLRTLREFEPWLQQKAMQIAQPDIVRCGITGGQRIIHKATEMGLKVSPHIGVCMAIGVAATWHITSVLENSTTQEHQLDMFETANKLLINPLQVEGGKAVVPTGPGLGISVDEDFVRKHSSETWKVSL